MQQELTTVPVAAFGKQEQLQAALRSCDLMLPLKVMEELNRLRNKE